MSNINGASHLTKPTTPTADASCPTCGSMITLAKYERIMKLDGARATQAAEARAALERERAQVTQERAQIATTAVTAARATWEAQATGLYKEAERQREVAETELARVARIHEKEILAEVKKREMQEKLLAKTIASARAKATADAVKQARDAQRQIREQNGQVISELRAQLKTVEDRDHVHFGPEGEADLVRALREQFPGDRIEHRGKAGDAIQIVVDGGKPVAKIVYEVKNTKFWQRDYLRQTQKAMDTHQTKYGILVSRNLPSRGAGMCVVQGVIVTAPSIATQIVTVLRDGIITIARLRVSEEDKSAKTFALYNYLRSDDFAHAIQRVQERIGDLRDALARERAQHDGLWTTREMGYAAILREASGIDARVQDLLGGRAVNPRPKALPLHATGSG